MPRVDLIGTYSIDVSQPLLDEAFDIKYGGVELAEADATNARAAVRDELKRVALVEMLIHDVDEACDIGDFGQSQTDESGADDQVAYAEVLLNDDGTLALTEPFDEIDFSGSRRKSVRIAFFLHFYDSQRPILTSYGPVAASPPTQMPERLRAIISYEPVG